MKIRFSLSAIKQESQTKILMGKEYEKEHFL